MKYKISIEIAQCLFYISTYEGNEMVNYQERIGEKNIAKNGLEMTIKEYRKYDDIDVEFEDGYIHPHVSYKSFLNGYVSHPKHRINNNKPHSGPNEEKRRKNKQRRLGSTKRMKNGMLCTIIAYRNSKDIDVEFEDGVKIYNRNCGNFDKGGIGHPDKDCNPLIESCREKHELHSSTRVGEKAMMNCGQECIIIKYDDADSIRVRFINSGSERDSTYGAFMRRSIQDLTQQGTNTYKAQEKGKSRIGEKRRARNGMMMEIVGYRNSRDVDVRFEDNEIAYHIKYTSFQSGYVAHPKQRGRGFKDRTGETLIAKNGLKMTVETYRHHNDIDIRFENGILLEHRLYSNFIKKAVAMPKVINGIMLKELAYVHDDVWYYICKHPLWADFKILSVAEVYEYEQSW